MDFKVKTDFLQKEADIGEIYAKVILKSYARRLDLTKDNGKQRAIETCRKMSNKGDAINTYNLGALYWNSGKEKSRAVGLFRQAFSNGHVLAAYKLGSALESGYDDVRPDPEGAVNMYQYAASKGHAVSQYRLGVCHLNGKGTMINRDKARQMFAMAASQGNGDAKLKLTEMSELDKILTPKARRVTVSPKTLKRRHAPLRVFRNILPELEAVKDCNTDDDNEQTEDKDDEDAPDCKRRKLCALDILAETATGDEGGAWDSE